MKNQIKKLTVFLSIVVLVYVMFYNTPQTLSREKESSGKQYVTDLNNAKCPVMGGDAQKNIFSVIDGKMYHFCCPSCITEFQKKFSKYAKLVKPAPAAQQVKYEIADNSVCPIMGLPVNKKYQAVKDGKLFNLCCQECVDKINNTQK